MAIRDIVVPWHVRGLERLCGVLYSSFVYWSAQCILEGSDIFVVEVCFSIVKQGGCYGLCGLLGEQALENVNGMLQYK
eukprot:14418457-Ditylum_brightwellii.AAC.1